MADDAPEEAPKKGKLKLILLLTVVVVLAIGLSIAGTLWFLKDQAPEAANGDDAETPEVEFQPSQYTVLEKSLVTTVQAEGRQRYAQVYVAFEADNAETLAATELHMPLLRSQLINVLASSDFLVLQTPEGRAGLAEDMLATVNETLAQEGEQPLKRVLLRNFVLQ
ncbi:flagellar basal body-associated FliL family protein [Marinobacter sp. SS21]|uniref:flagellar basal body-associated FliL family protein n=1 Tax=Marinobacter sp. SS21 TaxID=2979460 RepID=UPI002330DFC2|nr:flagellar basal body-associated FliL family protein [Marinobacter sp. SS21]MDC0662164.1 flagellar basal body-associated FliL family protein [Marinobacter sp. SS21]